MKARFLAAVIAGSVLTATLLAGPEPALAGEPGQVAVKATAKIMVLHATQVASGGKIDPALEGLKGQLTKPPFSAYNNYRLLDTRKLPVEKGKPAPYALPNGRTLQVNLLDITPEKRFHVTTAINDAGGKSFLKLLEVTAPAKEPFFVAGPSFEGGALVIAIAME